MTCELSYPSQILRKDSPLFDEILTDKNLLDLQDPTKNIPKEDLIRTTGALNKAFNGIANVSALPVNYPYDAFANDFPILAQKIKDSPITNVESAIFCNEYGLGVGIIEPVFNSYAPGSLPTQRFRDICGQLNSFYNANMGAALSSGLCGAFPNIFAKLTQVIAVIESVRGLIDDIKNFDPAAFLSGLVAQILGPLRAIAEAIQKTIESLAKSLRKAAKDISEDLCRFAASVKAGAAKIINKVKRAVTQVLDFLAEPNMEKLKTGVEQLVTGAASAFEKMDLETLALLMFRFCQLAGAVQQFMKKPLDGLVQMAVSLKAAQAMAKTISLRENKKAVEAGAVRIDPTEVSNLQNDARDRLNGNAPSVQEIVQRARAAENSFNLAGFSIDFPEIDIDKVIDPQTVVVVEPMARTDVKTISEEIKAETGIAINKEVGAEVPAALDTPFDAVEITPYVRKASPSEMEACDLNVLATDAEITGLSPYFTFSPEMLQQTKRKDDTDTGAPGPAWMEVRSDLWLKIIETQQQFKNIITIKAGYAPDEGALSTGVAVLIDGASLSEDSVVEIIIAASRAGITGISHTSSGDILLDDSQGRYGSTESSSTFILSAITIHEQNDWITWRPAAQVR